MTIISDSPGRGSAQAGLLEGLHDSDARVRQVAAYLLVLAALPAEGITRGLLGQFVVSRFEAGRDRMACDVLEVIAADRDRDATAMLRDISDMLIGIVSMGIPGELPGLEGMTGLGGA